MAARKKISRPRPAAGKKAGSAASRAKRPKARSAQAPASAGSDEGIVYSDLRRDAAIRRLLR
jgi:hypothetical protein